jgi:hypothetical protein
MFVYKHSRKGAHIQWVVKGNVVEKKFVKKDIFQRKVQFEIGKHVWQCLDRGKEVF